MKKGLLMTMRVGMMCLGLTSCGMRGNDSNAATPGTETNNSSLNEDRIDGYGGAQDSELNRDEVGNADAYTNDNANTQAKRSVNPSLPRERTAYDYLNDGRYRADEKGKVSDRGSELGRDLTQGARDMLKNARDLGRDMAADAGKAMRGVGNAARDVGQAAGDTLRDSLS